MLESSIKAVNKAILMFVEAESWIECKQVVQTQRDLLLTDAADQILVGWIKQSEDNAQATSVFHEYRNILARCRQEGIEVAFADRVRPSQEVYDAVLALVQAKNWAECKQLVEREAKWLLDEGANQVLLSWLKQSQQDPHAMRVFNEYRELLLRCRQEGIEAAFATRVRPPKAVFDAVRLLLAVKDETAAKTVLAERRTLLLSPAADQVLALWLKEAQHKPHTIKRLNTYRTWLANHRRKADDAASAGSLSVQALSKAVQAFVQAKSWQESKQIVVTQHDLLLSDMADQVLVILLQQTKDKPDAARMLQQHREVLYMCRHEGIEAAFASVTSQANRLSTLIQAFIHAKSWQESKKIVAAERDLLLSDEADQFLTDLIEQHEGKQKAIRLYQEHRQLLRRCRQKGIHRAFAEPIQRLQTLSETLLSFIDATDQTERRRIVEQHRDLLLTVSTDNLFAVLIKQAQKNPDRVKKLQRYRRLLDMCRTNGIELAFSHPTASFEVDSDLRARLMAVKSQQEFDELISKHPQLLSVLDELKPASRPAAVEKSSSPARSLPNEALAKTLFTFVAAPSWPESKTYLENHPELLSTEADRMLIELLAQHSIGEDEQQVLQEHHELLTYARDKGIQAAFANLAPTPQQVIPSIRKYMNAEGIDERKKIVQAERDLLLSDAADQVLADLQAEYQPESNTYAVLAKRRALLAQARRKGIEAAFAQDSRRDGFSRSSPPNSPKTTVTTNKPKTTVTTNKPKTIVTTKQKDDQSNHSSNNEAKSGLTGIPVEPEPQELDEDRVLETVLQFVEAKSWVESKRFVEQERQILLTDEAEQMLKNLLIQYQDNLEIARMLVKHYDLLQGIRRYGIDAAFAEQMHSSTRHEIPEEFMLELQVATAARERLKSDNSSSALNAAVDAWQHLFDQPNIERYANFKANVQSELGSVLLRRYWELEQARDVNAAIEAYEQALEETPRRAASLPGRLNNLGLALRARFALHRRQPDVNAAIIAYRRALKMMAPDANQRPSILNNLGVALTDRYSMKINPEDLNAAILTYEEALKLLPKEASNRDAIEENLKLALQDRFKYIDGLKKKKV